MSPEPPSPNDAAPLTGNGIFRLLSPAAKDAESRLISQAKAGDRHAMHQLLAPWNDRIFSFLLTLLHHRADAEDAAQETFVRVVKGLPGYEHSGQFQAWIYRIARNQAALTAQRRRRVTSRESSVEDQVLHDFPDQTNVSQDDERAEHLRHAVESLPPAEREVVRLRLDEDLKFREIAERTGAPLNTVLGRMRNAMRRLHGLLQPPP